MTTALTAVDRCDRCSAAALVLIEVNELPLQFCGHHYHDHEPALMELLSSTSVNVKVVCDQREVMADA